MIGEAINGWNMGSNREIVSKSNGSFTYFVVGIIHWVTCAMTCTSFMSFSRPVVGTFVVLHIIMGHARMQANLHIFSYIC